MHKAIMSKCSKDLSKDAKNYAKDAKKTKSLVKKKHDMVEKNEAIAASKVMKKKAGSAHEY